MTEVSFMGRQERSWRQASMIETEKLTSEKNLDYNLALVVSHDCDIHNSEEKEPFIEFVLGKITEKPNGSFKFGKNPRILHLQATLNGESVVLELSAPNKLSFKKAEIFGIEPNKGFIIDNNNVRILQKWLSARYNRHAFPDSLVNRLRKGKISDFLEKYGQKNPHDIVGYWVSYQPNIELPDTKPYEIYFNIVYLPDNADSERIANMIKEELIKLFDSMDKKELVLMNCGAWSSEEFTLEDLRKNVEYHLDYISNKSMGTKEIDNLKIE